MGKMFNKYPYKLEAKRSLKKSHLVVSFPLHQDLSIDENSARLAATERDLEKVKKEMEAITKQDTKLRWETARV